MEGNLIHTGLMVYFGNPLSKIYIYLLQDMLFADALNDDFTKHINNDVCY